MTLSQAQLEFKIRYYLWAGSEWEREISESFPNLQRFKSGTFWKTYQFMRRLARGDRLATARGLLKRFHPDAVKALGETASPEEEFLRFQRDEFFRLKDFYQSVRELETKGQQAEADALFSLIRSSAAKIIESTYLDDEQSLRSRLGEMFDGLDSSFEEKLALRKKAGEKVKFTGKKNLQNAITEKFNQVFDGQILKHDFEDVGDPNSQFDVKCGGWILSTQFWFGRGQALINYNQSLSSKNTFTFRGAETTYKAPLVIASMISLSSWLGITSQIEWEYIQPEEVDSTCDEVMKQVSHFSDVAPKLLKGLDVEKITIE